MYRVGFLLIVLCNAFGCTAQQVQKTDMTNPAIAFPGAEGFGKYATGGRGGKMYVVTNLNDKGAGSFRAACEAKDKRIIVFAIAGTIHLESKITIKGNCTIAGQSAPGDGICIADQSVSLGGDNIIIRYMRFRLGDKYQRGGMVDGNGADDALSGTRRNQIIIDHCSVSWSTDECLSVYAGDSTTLQWNIISEPLNYSYHFETGDKDYEQHGYGGIWGGRHLSAHHNLFAHCNSRTPRFDGIRNASTEQVDFTNNVIYNWGHNNAYAGEGGYYNISHNYYKPGPSTSKNVISQIVNPGKRPDPYIPLGIFYVSENRLEGNSEVTKNNSLGIVTAKNIDAAERANAIASKPFDRAGYNPVDAATAYKETLSFAGASFRRDSLDERIVMDVKNNTGKFIDVQGGFAHGTDYTATVQAWPFLKTGTAIADIDLDGMPDEWESKHGLNAKDPSDASRFTLQANYTNIECYLNELLKVK